MWEAKANQASELMVVQGKTMSLEGTITIIGNKTIKMNTKGSLGSHRKELDSSLIKIMPRRIMETQKKHQ